MKIILKLISTVTLGLGYSLASAQGTPPVGTTPAAEFDCPGAGGAESSTYQIWLYSNPTSPTTDFYWQVAQDFAATLDIGGGPGHLATFGSAAEETCVLDEAVALGLLANQQLWIGLVQDTSQGEPGGGWGWVNNEPFDYINWASGEPNDAGGEHHGTIGRYGYNIANSWNDEANGRPTIYGFVVEFDNTVEAQNCEGAPDPNDPTQDQGCNPSGVQNIQVPEDNNLQDGDTITEILLTPPPGNEALCGPYGFLDPRVDSVTAFPWDVRSLDVFAELGGAPAGAPGLELILDEYTYGSPCFAVAYGTTNFSLSTAFPNGLVITRVQFPEDLPGIVSVPACYDAVTNPDLQESSQLTYQTDDRFEMIEGTAAAMTEFCFNPSRALTRKFSFGVLNTREHCGIDFSSATGPDDVLACFQDLAVARFDALDQSLDLALPTLVSPKKSELTRRLNRARGMINSGNWSKATTRLQDLLDEVNAATWTLDDDNLPGDLVMRIENLLYRVDLLQQAEDNL